MRDQLASKLNRYSFAVVGGANVLPSAAILTMLRGLNLPTNGCGDCSRLQRAPVPFGWAAADSLEVRDGEVREVETREP